MNEYIFLDRIRDDILLAEEYMNTQYIKIKDLEEQIADLKETVKDLTYERDDLKADLDRELNNPERRML